MLERLVAFALSQRMGFLLSVPEMKEQVVAVVGDRVNMQPGQGTITGFELAWTQGSGGGRRHEAHFVPWEIRAS